MRLFLYESVAVRAVTWRPKHVQVLRCFSDIYIGFRLWVLRTSGAEGSRSMQRRCLKRRRLRFRCCAPGSEVALSCPSPTVEP